MKIHIQEAWWSAWQKYGWAKGIWGVGLKKAKVLEAIDKKEMLEITVGKGAKVYTVSPVTIKNRAEENKWIFKARGVELYVFPHNLLR